jgi:hypothetical protein
LSLLHVRTSYSYASLFLSPLTASTSTRCADK